MSSVQFLREFINTRLTAAAAEIFLAFQKTTVQYEEELHRLRRQLDIVLKPEIKFHMTEPPQQERNSSLVRDDPEPPKIKEEQHEVCTDLERGNPEPPQIKEEQEKLCPSLEGEQLTLKQETETFMLTPTCEESDKSEDPTRDLSPDESHFAGEKANIVHVPVGSGNQLVFYRSHAARSHNHKHEGSGSTGNAKPKINKRHRRSKNRNDNEDISTTLKITGNHSFKCDTCGKNFKHKSNLHRHVRLHSGQKMYQCTTCERSFSQQGTLKQHMTIHTGERPFPCNTCEKRFSRMGTLKQHMIVHMVEKPYPCNTCEKRFSRSGMLKQHMIVHTGKKTSEERLSRLGNLRRAYESGHEKEKLVEEISDKDIIWIDT